MKNTNQSVTGEPLPSLCRIKSEVGAGNLVIAYGAPTLGLKLLRASGMLFLACASAGIFLYFGFRGWHLLFEPDVKKKILIAVVLLVGAICALQFLWHILWEFFGRILLIASRESLRIQKQFLFFRSRQDIPSKDITAFQYGSDGVRRTKGYKLVVKGTEEYPLIPKEKSEESASWIGEKLSTWYKVPLIHKPFPLGRVRKR